MAIAIKSIPTLKKKDAKTFIKKSNASVSKKGTVDFSQQVKSASEILRKAAKQ